MTLFFPPWINMYLIDYCVPLVVVLKYDTKSSLCMNNGCVYFSFIWLEIVPERVHKEG